MTNDEGLGHVNNSPEPLVTGPKRQHFVPRFYLRQFVADDGCVAVFDRDQNAIRRQKPESTAVVGHLYTLRDDDGRQRYELEHELSRIEARASSILDILLRKQAPDAQERADFSLFMALAAVRTPEFLDTVKHLEGEFIKRFTKATYSDLEYVKQIVRQQAGKRVLTEAEVEAEARQQIEFAQGDNYEVVIKNERALRTAIPLADKIAPIMAARHWRVFEAPVRQSFITSDAPVVLTSMSPRSGIFSGIGFGTRDALTWMPLSERLCLGMFGGGGGIDYADAAPGQVRQINLAIARQCQRYIMARHDELAASVAQAARLTESKWSPRVQVT